MTLSAYARDDVGVTQLTMSAAGKVICSATSSVSCTWNLRKVANGTYPIVAVARDAAGNEGVSQISFTVGGTSSDTGPGGGGRGKKKR